MSSVEDVSVRELLRLSQTDITSEAAARFAHADRAWELAIQPATRASDPTAAGEALGKKALAAAELNHPNEEVRGLIYCSLSELEAANPATQRERIATVICATRIATKLALKHDTHGYLSRREIRSLRRQANHTLRRQHVLSEPFDRYASMHHRHGSVFETTRGSATVGAVIALRGIYSARRANAEQDSPEAHHEFVDKQTKANLGALAFAVSKFASLIPAIRRKRHQWQEILTS